MKKRNQDKGDSVLKQRFVIHPELIYQLQKMYLLSGLFLGLVLWTLIVG